MYPIMKKNTHALCRNWSIIVRRTSVVFHGLSILWVSPKVRLFFYLKLVTIITVVLVLYVVHSEKSNFEIGNLEFCMDSGYVFENMPSISMIYMFAIVHSDKSFPGAQLLFLSFIRVFVILVTLI